MMKSPQIVGATILLLRNVLCSLPIRRTQPGDRGYVPPDRGRRCTISSWTIAASSHHQTRGICLKAWVQVRPSTGETRFFSAAFIRASLALSRSYDKHAICALFSFVQCSARPGLIALFDACTPPEVVPLENPSSSPTTSRAPPIIRALLLSPPVRALEVGDNGDFLLWLPHQD